MADRTSLEDKSQCVATIGLLGFSYGSQIDMARRKERDYIKDELQHQVSDDKATKVIPGHPDGIEAGSMNMFQHVLGGDMVSIFEGAPVILKMCLSSRQTVGTDMF